VSGIGWEERGRLIRLLMSWYAEDPDFRAELCLLGALADRVPSLPRELWRLARTPAADTPAEQYSRALDALTGRYGLERLPRVDGQPGGADFLHAWCERRRGGAVLGPEHLALAAGASGTVPYMPGLEWNPTRESGADFERRDRAARTAYVTELRAAGHAVGGRPATERPRNLRWVYERMRGRKWAEIAADAINRNELQERDPDAARMQVTDAARSLAGALGIALTR